MKIEMFNCEDSSRPNLVTSYVGFIRYNKEVYRIDFDQGAYDDPHVSIIIVEEKDFPQFINMEVVELDINIDIMELSEYAGTVHMLFEDYFDLQQNKLVRN